MRSSAASSTLLLTLAAAAISAAPSSGGRTLPSAFSNVSPNPVFPSIVSSERRSRFSSSVPSSSSQRWAFPDSRDEDATATTTTSTDRRAFLSKTVVASAMMAIVTGTAERAEASGGATAGKYT